MNDFRKFVAENSRWFLGHLPETDESLDAVEKALDVHFPDDVRWLLCEYGYWHATGISSLDETIADTLAAREHLHLPSNLIVLYNHQDGGVILLDTNRDPATGKHKVYNAGWEFVPDRIDDDIVYPSLLDYVRHVLEVQCDFIADEDIDYDPTKYHNR